MITIFDYGAGNLRSVQNTLDELGATYKLVNDAAGIRQASSLILPGVGHFRQMMHSLDRLGVRQALVDFISGGNPFFGICLGMQALYEESEEAPGVRGLGLLPGTVRRFAQDARVPHMGWDQCEDRTGSAAPPWPYYYFAHSYYVPEDTAIATSICTYGGVRFTASLRNGNARGVQFHPEKSGAAGLQVMNGFLQC